MLSKEKILSLVEALLADKELFIIELAISPSNSIRLIIDSMKGVSINDCVNISRAIEHQLDRDAEDFDIEVSSPGLTEAFRIKEQYVKNIGKEVEVLLKTGEEHKGILRSVQEDDFVIEKQKRIRVEGKKKKQLVQESMRFNFVDCNKVRLVIKFK